eukprot:CAMPEP_0174892046 /NCGR_PEP_ID=MMETSP0167-20121228/7058_1 /TAXON_ID=38298 /ORGANISM="Rhodella maculata, Strain CCMP736" /LENGTH=172 /DNA_ID=CAMNT_0016130411 /DNA_START=32 /DNA_END=552 /DNA_ORIENTATION=+
MTYMGVNMRPPRLGPVCSTPSLTARWSGDDELWGCPGLARAGLIVELFVAHDGVRASGDAVSPAARWSLELFLVPVPPWRGVVLMVSKLFLPPPDPVGDAVPAFFHGTFFVLVMGRQRVDETRFQSTPSASSKVWLTTNVPAAMRTRDLGPTPEDRCSFLANETSGGNPGQH